MTASLIDGLMGALTSMKSMGQGVANGGQNLVNAVQGQPPVGTPQPQVNQVVIPTNPGQSLVSPSGYDFHNTLKIINDNPAVLSQVAKFTGLQKYDNPNDSNLLKANVMGMLSDPNQLEKIGKFIDKSFPPTLNTPTPAVNPQLQTPTNPNPQLQTPLTYAPNQLNPNFRIE